MPGFVDSLLGLFRSPKTVGPATLLKTVTPAEAPAASDAAAWNGDGTAITVTGASPGALKAFTVPLADVPANSRLELRFDLTSALTGGDAYPEIQLGETPGGAFTKGLEYLCKGAIDRPGCSLAYDLTGARTADSLTLKIVFGGLGRGPVTIANPAIYTAPLA